MLKRLWRLETGDVLFTAAKVSGESRFDGKKLVRPESPLCARSPGSRARSFTCCARDRCARS